MIFFFDRNIGKKVPRALKILGLAVEWHDDHFPQDCPDDQWMPSVAANGWTVIGHDKKFHQNQAELWAVKQHALGCFYLWGAQALKWEKVRVFARAYDKIVAAITTDRPPFVYRVDRRGVLRRVTLP